MLDYPRLALTDASGLVKDRKNT